VRPDTPKYCDARRGVQLSGAHLLVGPRLVVGSFLAVRASSSMTNETLFRGEARLLVTRLLRDQPSPCSATGPTSAQPTTTVGPANRAGHTFRPGLAWWQPAIRDPGPPAMVPLMRAILAVAAPIRFRSWPLQTTRLTELGQPAAAGSRALPSGWWRRRMRRPKRRIGPQWGSRLTFFSKERASAAAGSVNTSVEDRRRCLFVGLSGEGCP